MPIPTTIRVNPLDLQPNKTISVGLPFSGNAVFNKVYSTQERAKFRLINLVLTNKGEHLYNPDFGCDITRQLFEPITDDLDDISSIVINEASKYVPEVVILSVDLAKDEDNHLVSISISYKMKISGNPDQITINFE